MAFCFSFFLFPFGFPYFNTFVNAFGLQSWEPLRNGHMPKFQAAPGRRLRHYDPALPCPSDCPLAPSPSARGPQEPPEQLLQVLWSQPGERVLSLSPCVSPAWATAQFPPASPTLQPPPQLEAAT